MKFIYLLASFLLFSISYCQETKNCDYTTVAPVENEDYSILKKDATLLMKLTYSEAVKKFGLPCEYEELAITHENLIDFISTSTIEKHFANNKSNTIIKILTVDFKRLSQSYITVWYKFENGKWLPIETLTSV